MAINKLYSGDDTKENASSSDSDNNSQSSNGPMIRNDGNELQSWSYKNITIEPILFGLFFAVSLSDAVGTNLTLERTCENEFKFNHSTCASLNTDTEEGQRIESIVQPYAAVIIMAKSLISSILPAIMSIFLGPWSDLNGRRPLILFPLFGCTLMFILYAILSCIPDLHPSYLTLPFVILALTGGYISMVSGVYCYVGDVTREEDRSARLGLVDGLLFLGVMAGTVSSSYVFKAAGAYGYVTVFTISAVICAITFLYAYFFVPESVCRSEESKGFRGLFQTKLMKDMFATCFKKRENYKRAMIFLAIFSLASAVITMEGESGLKYLFVRVRFGWDITQFTTWITVHLLMISIGAIIGTAGLAKLLKISDAMLGVIAYVMKTAESLLYFFIPATMPNLLYLGGVIGFFGGICGPVSRSIISKCVPKEDLGKVFSLTSSVESLTPIAATPLYTLVYNATLTTLPAAFFLLSGGLFFINLVFFILIYSILRVRSDIPYERTDDRSSEA